MSFTVEASSSELAAPLPVPTCGESNLTKGLPHLDHEWPDFVPVDSAPLPEAKMFSGVKAIAVKLSGEAKGQQEEVGTPPLTGVATDSGTTNRAGLRDYLESKLMAAAARRS